MKKYRIKNWANFQHYKDRSPPWIKLHYELITSRDWVNFNDASKLLAVVCMMIASRNDGIIDDDAEYIRKVAQLDKLPNLKPLVDSGFLVLASDLLADASTMQANAIIEERRGEDIVKRREERFSDFEMLWERYGLKKDKKESLKVFSNCDEDINLILQGIDGYKNYLSVTGYLQCSLAVWLRNKRWENDYQQLTMEFNANRSRNTQENRNNSRGKSQSARIFEVIRAEAAREESSG